MVSFLLDLPEKDEEEVERAQIDSFDSLWGETGRRHLWPPGCFSSGHQVFFSPTSSLWSLWRPLLRCTMNRELPSVLAC